MQPSTQRAMKKDVGLAGPLFSWFDAPAAGKGGIAKAVLIGLGVQTAAISACRRDSFRSPDGVRARRPRLRTPSHLHEVLPRPRRSCSAPARD